MIVSGQEHDTCKPAAIFFLSSRGPWLSELGKWAEKENVTVVPVAVGINFNIQEIVLQADGIKSFIKQAMFYWMAAKHRMRRKKSSEGSDYVDDIVSDFSVGNSPKSLSPKMAVEFYGHFNFSSPSLQSDLFFSQQSNISKRDTLI